MTIVPVAAPAAASRDEQTHRGLQVAGRSMAD
jgi:hypothetical protein